MLETAGLVTTLRQGREKLHYLNAAPINDIADRWIHSYDRTRAEALSDLKTALEATTPWTRPPRTGEGTTFVYSTYIQATPEQRVAGTDRPGVHHPLLAPPHFGRRRDAHRLEEGLDLRPDLRGDRAR